MNAKEKLEKIGLKVPEILLPKSEVDLEKWAVIACDQFTSEKEYWEETARITEDSPTTLKLIYPECYLESNDRNRRIADIKSAMEKTLKDNIFAAPVSGFVLVDRKTEYVKSRKGLVVAVDLEEYDYSADSSSLIRASEGTIVDRLPPRMEVRRGAPIELPHIMLLINDPKKTVIEPLFEDDRKRALYSTPLMQGGGSIKGWAIEEESLLSDIADRLALLCDPEAYRVQYGLDNPLLFAAGDGNHSLATAKATWEEYKKEHANDADLKDHPSRYALIEIVNLYDDGLLFEPIHRLLIDVDSEAFWDELETRFQCTFSIAESLEELEEAVAIPGKEHRFGLINSDGFCLLKIESPLSGIGTGTIQEMIDDYLKTHTKTTVDYIHGTDATVRLGQKDRSLGILLPPVDKDSFFDTVVTEGALPRKTFSMGEASEKRYYLESRRIL